MSHPVLPRFDVRVLRDKSASDKAQVPAVGAAIKFYRPGATASQYAEVRTFEERIPVNVHYSGTLAVGDVVQVDGAGAQLAVDDIVSTTQVLLSNYQGPDAFVGVGSRLVRLLDQPLVYADPYGQTTGGTQLTTDGDGRAMGYVSARRFDHVVSGGGLTGTRTFADAVGEHAPSLNWLHALDYLNVQAAIDALPSTGGVVYLPTGNYALTSTLLIPKGKRVHLLGDGAGRTVLASTDPGLDMLWIKGSGSTIENLTLLGPNAAGSGRGIVMGLLAADQPTDVLRRVSIIGCEVSKTASWGLYVIGNDEQGASSEFSLSIWGHIERTVFRENKRATGNPSPNPALPDDYEGLARIGRGCTTFLFLNSAFCFFQGHGFRSKGAYRVSFLDCTFEDKLDDLMPYASLDAANNILLSGCWFEAHQLVDVSRPFVDVGPTAPCSDVSAVNCRFVRHEGEYPRLMRVGSSSKSVWLGSPTCTMLKAVATDRFSTTDAHKKDVNVGEGSEVAVQGGLLVSGALTPAALAITDTSRMGLVATGPRMSMPKVTSPERDDPTSLAVDHKPGDVIFNTDAGEEQLQLWHGADWSSLVDRRGTLDLSYPGSPAGGSLLVAAKPGFYRVSGYVVADPNNPATHSMLITLYWHDLEGAREKTLLSHAANPSQTTTAAADLIVMLGPGEDLQWSTNLASGYRLHLRAEAV